MIRRSCRPGNKRRVLTEVMDSKTLFTKISPVKLFFIASVPGAVSMLASALYQVIDGILVGQILGELAFAALNLAMPFVIINFSLADLIGVGSAVPISVSLGKKETKRADNIFTCACIMIVGAGVLIGTVLYVLAEPLLKLMGAQGELLELAVQYLRVYAMCAPITTIIFAVDNYLRICGKIKEQYVLEHIYVCTDSCSGVYVFVHIQMGNLGSRTCDLRRNVCLLRSSLLAVFTGQNGASFLQAGVFCKYGKADHKLRDAELSQQHCRACYIYSAEHFAFANGGQRRRYLFMESLCMPKALYSLFFMACAILCSRQSAIIWEQETRGVSGPLKNAVIRQARSYHFYLQEYYFSSLN
mgnify:CR=1 FL=1